MRAAQDTTGDRSATPIYDTLYSEYLRAFRALPGDRTGEEELGFTAFGTGPYGVQHRGHDPRHTAFGQFQVARYGQHDHPTMSHPMMGHHTTGHHHFPAALPPGPRREH
ncbi:hypothetical protein ACFWZ2_16260 [Streptomyces sp. NPDC059002]|uniref:hypothetical protein n=1 Tax=Streptomyces sp. NPDC059002 TaxID=3346690 RepID=UPI003696E168